MLNQLLNHPLFQGSAPHQTLKENPLGFIDIGARGGTHPLVEPLAGVVAVLGFEPDQAECLRMRQEIGSNSAWAVWDVEPCALGKSAETATLHQFVVPTNDSLRPANQAMVDRYDVKTLAPKGTVELQTVSLDQVLYQNRRNQEYWGEFIKIDTQGTEYEIFQGSLQTLSDRTVALLVEVEFLQMYTGQKLFSEVELFLRQFGFSFYGFQSLHHRSCKQLDKTRQAGRERLWWADAVFFKDPRPGNAWVKSIGDRHIHVLFCSALLLGYYDFALELALNTWATGAEGERITSLIHTWATITPAETAQAVQQLAQQVQAKPELANIITGHFVDQRRHINDYDDVIVHYRDQF